MNLEIKEKHAFKDKEFMDFIKKNRKNITELLDDFSLILLHYIFYPKEDITDSERILETDKIAKKIEHLHDSIGFYIQRYVDLDLGCNYTSKHKSQEKNNARD